MATGSVEDSQPAAAAPPGGSCCALLADPGSTIPQKGSQMGTKMASAIGRVRIEQEAVSPSGGALRGSNNPWHALMWMEKIRQRRWSYLGAKDLGQNCQG
jgi:hypothetical protein